LEAWRHASPAEVRTLGWIALPNMLCIPAHLAADLPVIDLMFFGSLLLWGLRKFPVTRLPQL